MHDSETGRFEASEPYVGDLPLPCIELCAEDLHCHGFVTFESACYFRAGKAKSADRSSLPRYAATPAVSMSFCALASMVWVTHSRRRRPQTHLVTGRNRPVKDGTGSPATAEPYWLCPHFWLACASRGPSARDVSAFGMRLAIGNAFQTTHPLGRRRKAKTWMLTLGQIQCLPALQTRHVFTSTTGQRRWMNRT